MPPVSCVYPNTNSKLSTNSDVLDHADRKGLSIDNFCLPLVYIYSEYDLDLGFNSSPLYLPFSIQRHNDFSNACHVGFHWIALIESDDYPCGRDSVIFQVFA